MLFFIVLFCNTIAVNMMNIPGLQAEDIAFHILPIEYSQSIKYNIITDANLCIQAYMIPFISIVV